MNLSLNQKTAGRTARDTADAPERSAKTIVIARGTWSCSSTEIPLFALRGARFPIREAEAPDDKEIATVSGDRYLGEALVCQNDRLAG